jgi:hypothetical protein
MASPKRQKVVHAVQVYAYDFTYFGRDGELPEPGDFVKLIRPLFKKWVFQEEACPTTGRKHYQGRGSLFKKKRHPELCNLLNETALRGMDVSEASNNSQQNELFYALKYDTRTSGPWMDTEWMEPAYIPRQLRNINLFPWQQAIMDTADVFDDRVINLLYDPSGCKGKSTVARLAQLHHGCLRLPPVGDHKQLLEAACDILMARQCRQPKLCFIDLPRSLTTDNKRFGPFMIAIEEIKGGVVCDMRNHFKEWWFDSPQVWVFCNHLPNVKAMSADRWKFWTVTHLQTLRQLSREDVSQMSQSQEE